MRGVNKPSSDDRFGERDRGSDPLPSGWGNSRNNTNGNHDDATRIWAKPEVAAEPAPKRQYYVPADAAGAPSVATATPPAPPVVPPGAPPGSFPGRSPKPKRIKSRRRKGRIIVVLLLGLVALLLVSVIFGAWQFSRIKKVPVGNSLATGSGAGTNYLLVGSDSREGFDPNSPNAGAVIIPGAEGDEGQRSDTMLVLRLGAPGGSIMTSVPRDLWVTRHDGSQGRINAAFRDGPAALIATIQQSVGIPIHHYVEVDFVTFAGLVDAVGGVNIEIPHPARDTHSGLDLPEAGVVRLDGVQALAYVRSRFYEEQVEGQWVRDPTGDLGRVLRQQNFLRAVMGEVSSTRNPLQLVKVSNALAKGLRIDDHMSFMDALGFARQMRGLNPESVPLPTYPYRTSGGAAVLGLVEPDANAVIERFQ